MPAPGDGPVPPRYAGLQQLVRPSAWLGEGRMSIYETVVVGTDGSTTSLQAVDRAGEVAARSNARLIIATVHSSRSGSERKSSAISREAADRAAAAGATDIEVRSSKDLRLHNLVDLAEEVGADLLVVGNVGLSSMPIIGRLFSVASSAKGKTHVLVVRRAG